MTVLAALLGRGGGADLRACEAMLAAQWPDAEAGAAEGIGPFAVGFRSSRDHAAPGPVAFGDGRFALLADLRLDNRVELGGELGIGAGSLPPDPVLAARCIERWGFEAIDRFLGDFALVVCDRREERLILARDFMGSRPLHFHRAAGRIAAATMAKGIFALPGVPLHPDAERLARLLLGLPHQGRGTCFAEIGRVEPGEVLTLSAARIEARKYWFPPSEALVFRDRRDYPAVLRETLDRAVADRLHGTQGVVATHLSGGIDSSAVTASAAMQFPGTVLAFTAVPPVTDLPDLPAGRFADEGPLAAQTAARYANIAHRLVPMPDRLGLDGVSEFVRQYERPDLNLPNFGWTRAIDTLAREGGARILLSATHGNDTISRTGSEALGQALSARDFATVARLARESVRHRHPGQVRALVAEFARRALPAAAVRRWRKRKGSSARREIPNVLDPQWPGYADLIEQAERAANPDADASAAKRLATLRRVDFGTFFKASLMATGVETRDPTADRRVVELCLRIPAVEFMRGGRPRGLAHAAFADRLPAEVFAPGVRGLQAPHWFTMLSAERPAAERILERLVEPARELLDVEAMQVLVRDWPDRSAFGPLVYRNGLLRGLVMAEFIRAHYPTGAR